MTCFNELKINFSYLFVQYTKYLIQYKLINKLKMIQYKLIEIVHYRKK